jgi:hypothetical protein
MSRKPKGWGLARGLAVELAVVFIPLAIVLVVAA